MIPTSAHLRIVSTTILYSHFAAQVSKLLKALPLSVVCALLLLLLSGCTRSVPDGHYHLEWGGPGNGFQTWNVKDGRMVINGPVLPDSVFSSVIEIRDGMLIVDPWVDATWTAKVRIEPDASMITEGDVRPLRIVPHTNCIPVAQYFNDRISGGMEDLQLPSNYDYRHQMAFPREAPNELIIGKKGEATIVMWDGVVVSGPGELPAIASGMEDIWIHVDQRVLLQEVLPWMSAAHEKGYVLHLSQGGSMENDEQVYLNKRDLIGSRQEGSTIVLDHCSDCELHAEEPVLVLAKLEFIGPDLLVFRGDTNDAFQTRNSIERFLGSGREPRLNARIDFYIPGSTPFYEYQQAIEEVHYAQYSAATITFYRNGDDPDQPRILELQERREHSEVIKEFPLRLREFISMAPMRQ